MWNKSHVVVLHFVANKLQILYIVTKHEQSLKQLVVTWAG